MLTAAPKGVVTSGEAAPQGVGLRQCPQCLQQLPSLPHSRQSG